MNRLRAIAIFLYDFVVGDDWRLALAVVLGLAAAGLLAQQGIPAWWTLPVVVVAALGLSVYRARKATPSSDTTS
jgi:hypothetical protein